MRSVLPTIEDICRLKILTEAAQKARLNAYAPYSKYLVGAAIMTQKGDVYVGCNASGADYYGTHAEAAALASMVVNGDRSPVSIVCVGALEDMQNAPFVAPCGACRQKIMEFASLSDYDVRILGRDSDQNPIVHLISDLLPDAFGPADLGINLAKYRR